MGIVFGFLWCLVRGVLWPVVLSLYTGGYLVCTTPPTVLFQPFSNFAGVYVIGLKMYMWFKYKLEIYCYHFFQAVLKLRHFFWLKCYHCLYRAYIVYGSI